MTLMEKKGNTTQNGMKKKQTPKQKLKANVLIKTVRAAKSAKTGDEFGVFIGEDGREFTCWDEAIREFVYEDGTYELTYIENKSSDRVYSNVVGAVMLDAPKTESAEEMEDSEYSVEFDDIPSGFSTEPSDEEQMYAQTNDGYTSKPMPYTLQRSIHCDVAFKGAIELIKQAIENSQRKNTIVNDADKTFPLEDIAMAVIDLTRDLADGLENIKRGE